MVPRRIRRRRQRHPADRRALQIPRDRRRGDSGRQRVGFDAGRRHTEKMRAVAGETPVGGDCRFCEHMVLAPRQRRAVARQGKEADREPAPARRADDPQATVRRGKQTAGQGALHSQQRVATVQPHGHAGPIPRRNPVDRRPIARVQIPAGPGQLVGVGRQIGHGARRDPDKGTAIVFVHPDGGGVVLDVDKLPVGRQAGQHRCIGQGKAGRRRLLQQPGIRLHRLQLHLDRIDNRRPGARSADPAEGDRIQARRGHGRVRDGELAPLREAESGVRPRRHQRAPHLENKPIGQPILPRHGTKAKAVRARHQPDRLSDRAGALNIGGLPTLHRRRREARRLRRQPRVTVHRPTAAGRRGGGAAGRDGGQFKPRVQQVDPAPRDAGRLPPAQGCAALELVARPGCTEGGRGRRPRRGGLGGEDIPDIVFQRGRRLGAQPPHRPKAQAHRPPPKPIK